ncbi:MAG TPA: STAS domain-containing protein [Thermoleophilaceae bacterium]|nr:STAS domain-containing protein [Thermoleophilaceae bacterium]
MLNFELESQVQGDRAIVTVRGDFDMQVAERVAAELTKVEAAGAELVVIDLRRLSFLDSAGMGVIAAAHARATDAGRRLAVVRPPYNVRRAFELSGFDDVVTVVESPDAI